MPFTVEDFEDLLRLLYERPEWRTRLRELILPPELLELPRIAQELAESNRVERERVARLEAEQHATRQEIHEGFAQTGEHLGRVETELATFRAETPERFEQTDIVFRSAAQTPVSYLAVEVSWMIDASDVLRAAERATLLAKTGQQVLAAVAGRRIQPDVLDLASRRGVEVVVDNTLDDRPRVDMGA